MDFDSIVLLEQGTSEKRRTEQASSDTKESTAFSTGNINYSLKELIATNKSVRKQWSKHLDDAITKLPLLRKENDDLRDKLAIYDETGQINILSTLSTPKEETNLNPAENFRSNKQAPKSALKNRKGKLPARLSKIEEAFTFNNTTKQKSPFNPKSKKDASEKEYACDIKGSISAWLKNEQVEINPNEKNRILDELTKDIIDRQKYLQTFGEIPNECENLEFLKLQVYRRLNGLMPIEALKPIIDNTKELLVSIDDLEVPQFFVSRSPSKTKRDQSPPRTKRDQLPTRTERDQSPTRTQRDQSPTRIERDQSPTRTERDQSPTRTQRDQLPTRTERDQLPTRTQRDQSPTRTQRDQSPTRIERDQSPTRTKNDRPPSKTKIDQPPSKTKIDQPPAKTKNDQQQRYTNFQKPSSSAQRKLGPADILGIHSKATNTTTADGVLHTTDDNEEVEDDSDTEFRPGQASTPAKPVYYIDKVTDAVPVWLDSMPIEMDPETRMEVINDIINDIVDRQKYLQMHPEKKFSEEDEKENLRFQVFKRLDKLFEPDSIPPNIVKIEELYKMIAGIKVELNFFTLPNWSSTSGWFSD